MTTAVIPAIGFGTYRLQGQQCYDAVRSALSLGYRHIDTAVLYDNEEAVGRAIADSGIARDKIFLTTKVWFDRLAGDGPIDSLRESLRRLGVEQVDLALIHWPSPGDEVPMASYIGALDRARQQGLTRHTGLSNFTIAQVDRALKCPGGEHLVTNQIEVHPYLANRKLVAHCQQKGLQVTGYMSLAVGKVIGDPVLGDIATTHGTTAAQVALAWSLRRGVAVIPSSTRPENQKANLAAVNIRLSNEEMALIDALDCNHRVANPEFAPAWD